MSFFRFFKKLLQKQRPQEKEPINQSTVVSETQTSNPQLSTSNIKIKLHKSQLLQDIQVPQNLTGSQLKTHIYNKLSDEIIDKKMSLKHSGVQILDNTVLSTLEINKTSEIVIEQNKIPLNAVSQIYADMETQDPISFEQGTVKMKCGHVIGREALTDFVIKLIKLRQYEIKCPHDNQNGQRCNQEWNWDTCRRIGQFTKTEVNQFEVGLSQNYMKLNCIACPNCKAVSSRIGLKTSRVRCIQCKSHDFCYHCQQTWKTNSSQICGNEKCRIKMQFVSNAPLTVQFKLKTKKNSEEKTIFKTPTHRACPNCQNVIQYVKGCKHFQCKKGCGKSFCWVCLEVLDGAWKCGNWDEYCGKVAQKQYT